MIWRCFVSNHIGRTGIRACHGRTLLSVRSDSIVEGFCNLNGERKPRGREGFAKKRLNHISLRVFFAMSRHRGLRLLSKPLNLGFAQQICQSVHPVMLSVPAKHLAAQYRSQILPEYRQDDTRAICCAKPSKADRFRIDPIDFVCIPSVQILTYT